MGDNLKNKCFYFTLPQIRVKTNYLDISSTLIFILGGRKPSVSWFKEIKRDNKIWCIDRGIDFCKENKFIPDFLIGDFDSAKSDSVDWALSQNVKIERHSVDKCLTDTQLALDRSNEIAESFVIITGVFGGRLDHLYSTLFSCANAKMKNCLADEGEIVLFLHSHENISITFIEKPIALSLLPLSTACKGVSIDGVYWPLTLATLNQSRPYAISNRIVNSDVNISLEEGTLAVYLNYV